MKAVILAAGMGKRLLPYTKNIPKCLLKIARRPLLAYQIDALAKEGIKDLVIVIGYLGNNIKKFIGSYKKAKDFRIKFIENKEYKSTGSSYSLWLARNEVKNGFIYINADLLFHHKLLNKLLDSKYPNSMIIDKNIDLDDDMVKVVTHGNKIKEMSRKRDFKGYTGEAVGPVKFSKDGAKKIAQMVNDSIKKGNKEKAFYFVMDDFTKKYPLFAIDADNLSWFEIDSKEDLKKAEEEIKKAIIFDFDGVIVDSEPLRYETYKELFLKEFCIKLPENYFSIVGKNQKETIAYFLKKYNLKGNVRKLIKKRKKLLHKTFSKKDNLKTIPGVLHLLKFLRENNFRLAIASSSSKEYINNILDSLKLGNFFDLIISGDNIKKGKPDPEIFLITAKKIGKKSEDCVVIEDSINGVIAAKKAGMKVIAITSSFKKEQLKQANIIINNLNEIGTSYRTMLHNI